MKVILLKIWKYLFFGKCPENSHKFPTYHSYGFSSTTIYCAKDEDLCLCKKYTFKEYKMLEFRRSLL